MPVQECQSDGRPGFRWGNEGHCYQYTPGDSASRARARRQAVEQGQAIEASQHRERERER